MQPTPRHRDAESRLRRLLADAALPQPDDLEYTPASVIFRWQGPMVAVVIDFVDPADTCGADCGTLSAWLPELSERG